MAKNSKEHLPKVGEKMYYRASYDNKIHEAKCYEIEKEEGICTKYFTSPKSYKIRGFINESELLDPHSKAVQNYLNRDFKKYEKQFNAEWDKYVAGKGGGAITVNIKDLAKHFFRFGLNITL